MTPAKKKTLMGKTRPNHHPKIQHYVPKMLLRNFGFGKKNNPKIHAFDKHEGKFGRAFKHPTAIRNVAAESGFYDFEVGDRTASIESTLAFLEYKTASAFKKLFEEKNLGALTDEDKAWISVFVASQHVRGRHFRESTIKLDEAISEKVRKTGGDPNDVKGWRPFKDENELKAFASMFLLKSSKEFSEAISGKAWVLLETSAQMPFWIGDNPVAMHNDEDFGPYGNIGLLVPGIQIYLPLSPTLTLGMWCPQMVQKIFDEIDEAKKTLNEIKMLRVMMPTVNQAEAKVSIAQCEAKLKYSEQLRKGIETSAPVPCVKENVTFMNSLQVAWAYRFIMSDRGDFSLAELMIKEHPHLREGRTMTLK